MQTIFLTDAEADARIARFDQLDVIEAQKGLPMSQDAADIIFSRELRPVVGLAEGESALGSGAPVRGAGGITITLAMCPSGTGPSLHTHRDTWETFTVLEGSFEFRLNDDGGLMRRLERFDAISVPPRVSRAFRSVGDQMGVLQVLISGGVHDKNDIAFPRATAQALAAADDCALPHLRSLGFKFDAGEDHSD